MFTTNEPVPRTAVQSTRAILIITRPKANWFKIVTGTAARTEPATAHPLPAPVTTSAERADSRETIFVKTITFTATIKHLPAIMLEQSVPVAPIQPQAN